MPTHAAHVHDLAHATMVPAGGGYDLTKAAQTPQDGRAAFSMTRAKQAPAVSTDHPLALHSPRTKARYSPKSRKGRHMMAEAFHEVEEDEPAVVAMTRRKKGAKAAKRQKTAIALSKARRAGVRIPRKG